MTAGIVIWLMVSSLYWPLMESSSKQGTVGKQLLGIVVTDAEGNRISFGKAMLRHLGKLASTLPALAGFVMAVFTVEKRALKDLITGSRVVVKQ